MNSIQFPGWDAGLEDAELPHRLKNSFRITIRWYLSFCRRARVGITHESARSFIAWTQGEKQPQDWQLEQWKEGIR